MDLSGSVILESLLLDLDEPLPLMPSMNCKEVVAAGCWYLWWLRRQHTHHDGGPPQFRWPNSILAIVGNHLKSIQKREVRGHKWTRPDPKFVKLNVDASYHSDDGMGATAAVLRDEKGVFIAAQCRFYHHAADAMTMEALAMRDGLILANSMGFNRVEAESDSQNVVNYCQGQDQWWDSAAAIFAECIDVATSIGKVIFTHCFREVNYVAHELAKFSYCNKCDYSWTIEPSVFIVGQLVNDVIVL
jgi:ribonuclease HI